MKIIHCTNREHGGNIIIREREKERHIKKVEVLHMEKANITLALIKKWDKEWNEKQQAKRQAHYNEVKALKEKEAKEILDSAYDFSGEKLSYGLEKALERVTYRRDIQQTLEELSRMAENTDLQEWDLASVVDILHSIEDTWRKTIENSEELREILTEKAGEKNEEKD